MSDSPRSGLAENLNLDHFSNFCAVNKNRPFSAFSFFWRDSSVSAFRQEKGGGALDLKQTSLPYCLVSRSGGLSSDDIAYAGVLPQQPPHPFMSAAGCIGFPLLSCCGVNYVTMVTCLPSFTTSLGWCKRVWCTPRWIKNLFRIPHMPPAGSLKVLHAPAHRRGIRRASQTKIYNLETNEFVSSPPFLKNLPKFWWEQLELIQSLKI